MKRMLGEKSMKVFISWSGNRSKKIALIIRDWLPTVIQSIEPFVSSEDIEKGSRWNTDIAQELKDSSFGIICVTKDNLCSPWLNFESGALSKLIDNSYVAPLLFDVKHSDLTGSPIAQFQTTSFNIDDMKRLIETLNVASGSSLTAVRLNKAFELCYPDLEKSIQDLKDTPIEMEDESDPVENLMNSAFDSNILEELLETARNTQRLLGNTDSKLYGNIDEVNKKVEDIIETLKKQRELEMQRNIGTLKPRMIEELAFSPYGEELFPYNILMILATYKEDFPWLYDAGYDLVKTLRTSANKTTKDNAIKSFLHIIERTCGNPLLRDVWRTNKDAMRLRDLPLILSNILSATNNY